MSSETNDWNLQTRRNTINLMLWTFSWTLSVALATFGPLFLWTAQALTIGAILLNIGIGIGMIFANRRFITGLDELQKKIQLEAMAVTLGVALVVGIGYSLLDSTNLIKGDAEISYLIIVMAISYMVGIVAGRLRYL